MLCGLNGLWSWCLPDKVEFTPRQRKGNWLLRTFGEGCPKSVVIWAVMPLSHFRGYHSDHFFNSIR
jgi:hypothetical protein